MTMGAMKNRFTDGDFNETMALCASISTARDEYREEMFRLREINAEMLAVLKVIEGDIHWHDNSPTLRMVRKAIKQAE
jgi:hypothetical protein